MKYLKVRSLFILALAVTACAEFDPGLESGSEENESKLVYELDRNQKACPAPTPHYKSIGGTCLPSCGVILNGRNGVLAANACPKSYVRTAERSWEESVFKKTRCCVAENESTQKNPAAVKPAVPMPVPSYGISGVPVCHFKPDNAYSCRRESSDFLGVIESAIDRAIALNPYLANTSIKIWDGHYLLNDRKAFGYSVAQVLISRGYSACYNGEEVSIKNSEGYSENYDLEMYHRKDGQNYIRRGAGSYMVTCTPAQF